MADLPDNPNNREEEYLADIAGLPNDAPENPWSRKEAYLAAIGGRLDGIDARIAALATDISFKGSVPTADDLPENAAVGDAYITEDTGIIYVYVGESGTDPWVALGGTGINVVQTTGTSTTDVMSQNATASMVFADPGPNNQRNIRIGDSSAAATYGVGLGYYGRANGQASVAIGRESNVSQFAYKGAVALGAFSSVSAAGEVNVGSSVTSAGYNNTNYRLISGVHDPQSAHDAATKGYVDTLVGNVEAALNAINNGGNA